MKRLILALVLSACSIGAQAMGISGQGTWESTLLARDVNNDSIVDAYYDTVLDITWLADASYAVTSGYLPSHGTARWPEVQTWVSTLNSDRHLGVNDWRSPVVAYMAGTDCPSTYSGPICGYNVDTNISELANLFYDTLGNLAKYDASGNEQLDWGLSNTGPFINLRGANYHQGSESAPDDWAGWFNFHDGMQMNTILWTLGDLWVVTDGDIALTTVPIPAAFYLFGSALGLLGWMRRRVL